MTEQPVFSVHKDLLWAAVTFRLHTYKDPAAHSRKMEKKFGPAWNVFVQAAADAHDGKSCLAVHESNADALACARLSWKTLEEQRSESFRALKTEVM